MYFSYKKVVLLLICTVNTLFVCNAQSNNIYKYSSIEYSFIIDELTLGDDHFFYFVKYCECNTDILAKGTWSINRDTLILQFSPIDSFNIYPSYEYVFNDQSDSVEFYFKDIYNQQYSIPINLIPISGKIELKYLNDTGYIKISKRDYTYWGLFYEPTTLNLNEIDKIGYYPIVYSYLNKVIIKSSFASYKYFAPIVRKENWGILKYLIIKDELHPLQQFDSLHLDTLHLRSHQPCEEQNCGSNR